MKKSRTVIDDDAFIGCNANLIAPVHIGQGAYIAAGSTVTDDVPPAALAIARARQQNKRDWANRHKLKEKNKPRIPGGGCRHDIEHTEQEQTEQHKREGNFI